MGIIYYTNAHTHTHTNWRFASNGSEHFEAIDMEPNELFSMLLIDIT